MKFTDAATIGEVKQTQDGYLVATARVGRTGIQEYRASELGLIGDGIVKVYRPEKEVFSKDALASMSRVPVTINHPDELVNSDNWAEMAKGEVGDGVMRDGEWIVVNPMIKDATAAQLARTTHRELSLGYTADLKEAPEGADYDFEMENFKFNHLALVPAARAGHQARIGDAADNWGAAPLTVKDEEQMDLIKIMVGDKAVQVAAKDADLIAQMIKDHAAEIAERDAAIGEHMAKIANLEAAQLTDADIEAKAEERAAVLDKAAKFIDGLEAKGKTTDAIKREVLALTYGDKAADFPEAAVDAMFEVIEPVKKNDAVRTALGDMEPADNGGNWDFLKKKDKK